MTGRKLYELYLETFTTPFAPRWSELSDHSKNDWWNLANKIYQELSLDLRGD